MMNNGKAADCLVIDGIVKTTGGYVHDTAGAYDHDTADAFHRMELTEEYRAPLAGDALATRAKGSWQRYGIREIGARGGF